MRNIKLIIEYDGTDFCGWQVQTRNKDKESIQSVIQDALKIILKESVRLTGSGRTDSGVHAKGQAANFKTKSCLPLRKLHKSLNGILPGQIRILKVENVPLNFNSRFDASSKTYRYTILNRRVSSPFCERFSYFVPQALNLNAMKKTSGFFIGNRNFKAFHTREKTKRYSSVRRIDRLAVTKNGDFVYIDIKASGFLHNMARRIAGALIQVGSGKISPEAIKKSLTKGCDLPLKYNAPSKGLCLIRVKYA